MLIDFVGYFATLVSTLAFMPQVLQVFKTKSVNDISLLAFSQNTFGALLWIVYGLLIHSIPVVITNTIIGCLCLLIIFAKYKYK